ncbi:hypothetical protein SAMN06264849_11150 [Melghirimyces algeriensis]|uniref:Uncharacterized protein n=1 Tax=Melghirimyces algeriensis TaxID=910412 RepID=A0A521EWY8_9BACL|nr:hypothetical protein SAMN06264849_11150 [Melghirimyces algeriensis]
MESGSDWPVAATGSPTAISKSTQAVDGIRINIQVKTNEVIGLIWVSPFDVSVLYITIKIFSRFATPFTSFFQKIYRPVCDGSSLIRVTYSFGFIL